MTPINCQGDQETYFTLPPGQYWTDCGYRYETPLPELPSVDIPTSPVPEPAAWALMLASFAIGAAWVWLGRLIDLRNR